MKAWYLYVKAFTYAYKSIVSIFTRIKARKIYKIWKARQIDINAKIREIEGQYIKDMQALAQELINCKSAKKIQENETKLITLEKIKEVQIRTLKQG
tara:strand:+ start:227 stop:517 length:291 start_codon:yes stop_codon:yes gene_type:complete